MLQKNAILFREKYATSFSHIFFAKQFGRYLSGITFVGLDFKPATMRPVVRDRARDFLTNTKVLGDVWFFKHRINGDQSNGLVIYHLLILLINGIYIGITVEVTPLMGSHFHPTGHPKNLHVSGGWLPMDGSQLFNLELFEG